jgi:hypothetical protein
MKLVAHIATTIRPQPIAQVDYAPTHNWINHSKHCITNLKDINDESGNASSHKSKITSRWMEDGEDDGGEAAKSMAVDSRLHRR